MKRQLELEIVRLQETVGETKVNLVQFKTNIKAKWKLNVLESNLMLLSMHKAFIGQSVYQNEENFTYSKEVSFRVAIYRPYGKEKIKFTKKMYLELEQKLLSFFIEKMSKELVNGIVAESSTNKFYNLVYEWEIESKQEIIKLYKEIQNATS